MEKGTDVIKIHEQPDSACIGRYREFHIEFEHTAFDQRDITFDISVMERIVADIDHKAFVIGGIGASIRRGTVAPAFVEGCAVFEIFRENDLVLPIETAKKAEGCNTEKYSFTLHFSPHFL